MTGFDRMPEPREPDGEWYRDTLRALADTGEALSFGDDDVVIVQALRRDVPANDAGMVDEDIDW